MPTLVPEAQFRAVHEEWCQGCLTQAEAAARLEVCVRTFRRYVDQFRSHGAQWWDDESDKERRTLQTLYSEHYQGWNVRHFYERYRDEHGAKRPYTWVKNVLQDADLVEWRTPTGIPNKRTREKDAQESSGRKSQEGFLLHQIASGREWVSGHTWDLVPTVDDATNKVYSGFFVNEFWVWSIFRGIRETPEYGLFHCLSLTTALPARLGVAESTCGGPTRPQVERAILELGIDSLPPDPHAGARRRRMIGTLRGRLPQELLDVLCLKHQARIRNGNCLLCMGREVAIPRGGRRRLFENSEYRIHEYVDGGSKIFWRRKTGTRLKRTELP